jgi:tetratricopeptide (TPR) repeat protein
MRSAGVLVATAFLLTGPSEAGSAQRVFDQPPKRPRLNAQADTNSAPAYYAYGIAKLQYEPDKAAAAFYWASRLDPSWVAPLYGQHTALLLAQPPNDLTVYLTQRRLARRNPGLQRIDSLALRALLKNPFVDRRLDGVLLSTWLARETGNQTTLRDLGSYDRRFTAWAAYTRGDYPMATKVFAELIRANPEDPDLRVWRALAFFAQGQLDSARVVLQEALRLERTAEEELPGYGWVSQAFVEYSIGLLYALTQQADSARAAYERALLDDLTLHSAHHQLGKLRLARRDTAGALGEFTQAVTLEPTDATYLYDLGMLLIATAQTDSGVTVLRHAIAEEPFFAAPHYALGIVHEQAGLRPEAAAHFERFLALAPRTMAPAIASARTHLEKLR